MTSSSSWSTLILGFFHLSLSLFLCSCLEYYVIIILVHIKLGFLPSLIVFGFVFLCLRGLRGIVRFLSICRTCWYSCSAAIIFQKDEHKKNRAKHDTMDIKLHIEKNC
uniref:Uncharacterized protein n=1 Tax=Cacopsylla melanoneura TaxID=428564 RepID=A0A8D8YKR5_9HEMI